MKTNKQIKNTLFLLIAVCLGLVVLASKYLREMSFKLYLIKIFNKHTCGYWLLSHFSFMDLCQFKTANKTIYDAFHFFLH